MKNSKSAKVLVAVMNNLFDFEILKKYRWYRIPVKSEKLLHGKITDFEYLAFYQTKIFGKEKYAVNYMAKIQEIEKAKRADLLPEEKNHPRAQDEYFKIKIDRITKLQKSIVSKRWRRIVFIPTTMEKLMRAEEINDLYNDSPLEDILWDKLKQNGISAERQYFHKTDYCFDFAIMCNKGLIDVECDGKRWHSSEERIKKDRDRNNTLSSKGLCVLRFDTDEITNNMDRCMGHIKEAIKNLAGIKEDVYETV